MRGARVGRPDDGPGCPVPVFDDRLVVEVVGEIVADGPAIRRRSARHSIELVFLRGAGVRRANDGPRWSCRSERHARRRIRGEAEHCEQNADRAKSKSD